MEKNETFDFFVNAKLPDQDGWKRDFSDTHFVERYLKGYLILSQMHQKEINQIAKTTEKHQKKAATQINKLTAEVKKLNTILISFVTSQEQMTFDFKALKKRNESAIKMLNEHINKDIEKNV